MANNRMFLVHVPTGLAVSLGKRMDWGWYLAEGREETLGKAIAHLYETLENDYGYAGRQDDFALAMEDAYDAKGAIGEWNYGDGMPDDPHLVRLSIGARA